MPTENFSTEPVNFVAASDEIFNIWTDGINALLGKQVSNTCTVHSLVDVTVKWSVYAVAANVNIFDDHSMFIRLE